MKHLTLILFLLNANYYSVFSQVPDSSLTYDTLTINTLHKPSDSDETRFQQTLVSFASSYTANQNWQNNDYKNYSLMGNVDEQYRKSSKKFLQVYQFRGELSYLKFVDSTQAAHWLKNSDFFNLSAQWTEFSEKKLKHSYSFLLKSQFTDTWKYSYVSSKNISEPDTYTRKWKGGFMNPATITLAYGLNYTFGRNSYINFAFATVNVYTRPRASDALLATEKELARTERTLFISEYGMSIQSLIQHKLNDYVIWDNKINFFSNGINRNQVNLDFQNRVTFRFLKYFQFRVSTYLIYNPLYSFRMQYRHEFLTGIFWENRMTKKKK